MANRSVPRGHRTRLRRPTGGAFRSLLGYGRRLEPSSVRYVPGLYWLTRAILDACMFDRVAVARASTGREIGGDSDPCLNQIRMHVRIGNQGGTRFFPRLVAGV